MAAKRSRTGNSRRVRLPQPSLERRQRGEEVVPEAQEGRSGVRALSSPREGWPEQFKAMAEGGDDTLLDADAATTTWDGEEWEWWSSGSVFLDRLSGET